MTLHARRRSLQPERAPGWASHDPREIARALRVRARAPF
ncbi:hypothetical protein DB30_03208 [Enhygromyxa salina]|uniref:Uncharacterized protein n=1 Tax=Enhygromyxa salina TaxID=215803 RepID=A0A0C2DCQ9_9BACT|nr:hypothetical protein DB30_03208 [Enhygromyxa salina]